jgi:phosphatidylglycerophosphatase A
MELTNVLLSFITVLLTVIGFFLFKFYDEVKSHINEFHKAMLVQASHEERIRTLERENNNQ